ncbi:MAG: rhomboid family intramembrane serine protease [Gammaproteobacteria bacterium]|nr:rhomboid family intramembrane serine protease [Gammaproteobacteria bacterium]
MIPVHDDNPVTVTPVVTWALIAGCVAVFVWQLGLGDRGNQLAAFRYGVVPAVLLGEAALPPEVAVVPASLTVLTSMFLHGGFLHLAGNMLYLWIFGNNVEDALGHGRYLAFYALSGLAAALAQALHVPDSTIPMIGASGAISGVLAAYLLYYPHARVTVLVPLGFVLYTVRWPAVMVLGLWFVMQVGSSLLARPDQPGVAWLAHIGGFAAGLLLAVVLRPPRR